jgi:UDP-3-O-[3-hydroxymyristoyl] glucosamine N-acyltransferase
MPALTLLELAERIGAHLEDVAPGVGERTISGPASLTGADHEQVSFLADARHAEALETTRACAVVLGEGVSVERKDLALLRCGDPQAAFNRVVGLFAPEVPSPESGVHPSAVVHPTAEVEDSACIGPLCVVGPGVRIAAGVVLHARVVLGASASVGADTVLYPGVVLYPHVSIGASCIVHAGAVLGSDGFGFEPTESGWVKTPQGGTVLIEDDVEIGANVTIDCARFGSTHIASNVKIDNLVHVAHNVRIGRSSMFLAQSAVAGSTQIGSDVIVAGQTGIAGHLSIGEGARIGAKSAVFTDIPAGEEWWGSPAVPKTQSLRDQKSLQRVGRLREELTVLRERLRVLEEGRP